jgi:hypothetical protein
LEPVKLDALYFIVVFEDEEGAADFAITGKLNPDN